MTSNRVSHRLPLGTGLSNEHIAEEDEEEDCDSLLLMNPNATEEPLLQQQQQQQQPQLPTSTSNNTRQRSGSFGNNTSTKITVNGGVVGDKKRSKSPSFFKMIVGGAGRLTASSRKTSSDDLKTPSENRGSLSDTEDLMFYSPTSDNTVEEERQRLNHFATLPRKEWRRPSTDKMTHINWHSNSYSPEDTNTKQEPLLNDKQSPVSLDDTMTSSDSPLFTEIPPTIDYQPAGLDALEMLHNQLQILVRQDCDQEMGDLMDNQVVETLQKQNTDLQRSLECLQSSDQNLRVSLRMAEMRAQEAEIKLHHSADRCHKLERDCRWLETEFKILYQKYHELQRHLQKKAILHQMSLGSSRTTGRRPNSAQARRQRSFDAINAPLIGGATVKRHNSSEFIHSQQQQNNKHYYPPAVNTSNTGRYNSHISSVTNSLPPSSSNTLPRAHSGSMSHTETRV